MSPEDLELAPAERRARDAVRGLPLPEAEHAFRDRLRRDFASGHVGERRAALVFSEPWYRRAAVRWALTPVLAVVLVTAAILVNRTPGWGVAGVHGTGTITVGGRPVSAGQPVALAQMLHPGVHVRTPEGARLVLASAGFGMIEMTPGSDLTLPAPPGRWFARNVQAEVQGGVVRFSTAPMFRGARLAIQTPDAQIQVTGTTFAVLCMPAGTCVCVLEGKVKVGERDTTMVEVAAGRRREIYNTGQPPLDDRMLADEVHPLTALREQVRGRMGGR